MKVRSCCIHLDAQHQHSTAHAVVWGHFEIADTPHATSSMAAVEISGFESGSGT
jgi:hypothetical protein